MQRINMQQIAVIVIGVLILATARSWPWPLQFLAIAAAGVGAGGLAWREAGGRLPWLPQRPRVTYWRGRPVPVVERPQRLRITPASVVYGVIALCCATVLVITLLRLVG